MSFYLLPTKGATKYRGKYPSRIKMVSYSPLSLDKDGNKCVHIETNCGERFTCSLDRLENTVNLPRYGVSLNDALKANTVLNTMTQEQYNAWLSDIKGE